MRPYDALWIMVGGVLVAVLALGLEGCRMYRHCRAGRVLLVGGPSRLDAPSHDRCVTFVLRGR